MNAFVFSLKSGKSFSDVLLLVPRRTILLSALLLIFVCHPIAVGQSDDFNDGDDSGAALGIVSRLDRKLFRLDQCLPISLNHDSDLGR